MYKNFLCVLCLGGMALITLSCSQSSSNSSGNLKISFTSSSLASASSLRLKDMDAHLAVSVSSGTSCQMTVESTTTTGKCYTPLKVGGFFDQASLANTSGGMPVRLLGGGEKYYGFQDIMRHEAFDLASSLQLDGDDNIQDGTAASYNKLTMRVQSLFYQFEASVGGSTKYYTVRVFLADSKPSESTTLTGCSGLSAGALAEADTYGDLYAGISAKKGDVMVCIQSTAAATCSASDFKWVDSSGITYATRPTPPLLLSGAHLTNTPSCTYSADRPDITWGSSDIAVSLAQVVTVSATQSGGVKTYKVGSSSGTALTAAIDITATHSIFIPDSASAVTNLSTVSDEATLLQNLNKIFFKPIFKNNSRTSISDSGDAPLSGTVTLTVTSTASAAIE